LLTTGSAIVDATESITLESTYIKGYYRRGTAYLALCKLKQAKADFRHHPTLPISLQTARGAPPSFLCSCGCFPPGKWVE
jgi:hypothetical protein